MMNNIYWLVSIVLRYANESVLNSFYKAANELGVADTEFVEDLSNSVEGLIKLDLYFDDQSKCRYFMKSITETYDFDIEIKFSKLEADDWKTKWKDNLEPIELVADYRVLIVDNETESIADDNDILISAELVFGAGNHPTTRTVAKYIYNCKNEIKSFLDIGTGTGILSILAARCGAENIWVLDIEEEAVKNTKKNLKLNGCSIDHLECCDFNKFDKHKLFDFVAANVLSKYLVEMKTKILSYVKVGGYLAVSGISSKNYSWFRDSFDQKELIVIDETEEEGWHAVLYKKIGNDNED